MVAVLRAKASGERLSMPQLPRMSFRLHLLQRGAITESELGEAQRYARERLKGLSEAMLELGSVPEEQLAAAHAAESGCAFFALPAAALAHSVRLPRELVQHYEAATVHATRDRVLIGFVHRLDRTLLAAVEQVVGRRAEGCFITASRYEAQLMVDRAKASSIALGMPVRSGTTRAQAGRLVRDMVLREGAEWMRVSSTRDAVWIRWWRSDKIYGDLVLAVGSELESKAKAGIAGDLALGRPTRIGGPKREEKKLRIL